MNKADGINALRDEINAQQFNILRLQQNEEMLKAQSKIANSRMERGCVPVVDPEFKTINGFKYFNLVTLQKGQPVRDRTNQTYLPAGTVVCGANGDTAELVLNDEGVPVAQNFAVGGSKALVEKNVQRFAGSTAKVFWNTPTVVN
ncbi:MAG: hypothetical protein AAFR37_24030 [Cyanobacteria bacterium J06628_3]